MQSLIDAFKKSNNLHHAYILEGHQDSLYPRVCEFCEKELKFKTKANPDFYYEIFERFSIADARHLHEMQMRKTTDAGRKIFVIAFSFITKEAQNALLKVLEEPTKGTHFFFITSNTKTILDTVLSRVIYISNSGKEAVSTDDLQKEADDFLKGSYKKRLAFIAKIVNDIKDEKRTKSDALTFLQILEKEVHKNFLKKPDQQSAKSIKEIQLAEQYLHDHGSSTKQLLEHVALLV